MRKYKSSRKVHSTRNSTPHPNAASDGGIGRRCRGRIHCERIVITFEDFNHAQKKHGFNFKLVWSVFFFSQFKFRNDKIRTNDQLPHAPRTRVVRDNPRAHTARNRCRTDDWLTHRDRHAADPPEQPRPFPTTASLSTDGGGDGAQRWHNNIATMFRFIAADSNSCRSSRLENTISRDLSSF